MMELVDLEHQLLSIGVQCKMYYGLRKVSLDDVARNYCSPRVSPAG